MIETIHNSFIYSFLYSFIAIHNYNRKDKDYNSSKNNAIIVISEIQKIYRKDILSYPI